MSFRTHLTTVAAALFAFSVQAADGIPTQAYDAGLAAQLPASVQKAGVLRNVVTGNFALYTIANPDNSIKGVPHPKHRHGRGKPLVDMLHDGDIDAMFQAFMPKGYFTPGELNLRPVVEDFKAHEAAYFKKTGYVPGIHILAMKESFVKKNPWAVKALCEALDDSRKMWREKRRRYAETTPWIIKDLIDEGKLLGEDYGAYGFAANKRMTDDFCREAYEQQLNKHLNTAEKLFPEEYRL